MGGMFRASRWVGGWVNRMFRASRWVGGGVGGMFRASRWLGELAPPLFGELVALADGKKDGHGPSCALNTSSPPPFKDLGNSISSAMDGAWSGAPPATKLVAYMAAIAGAIFLMRSRVAPGLLQVCGGFLLACAVQVQPTQALCEQLGMKGGGGVGNRKRWIKWS